MNKEISKECTHDCATCSSACLSKFMNTEVVTKSDLYEDGAVRTEDSGKAALESCVLAIDLGTTTIAMQLIGRASRRIYDTYTCLNPQLKYGADVISRVAAAKEHAAELQDVVMSTIAGGIRTLLAGRVPGEHVMPGAGGPLEAATPRKEESATSEAGLAGLSEDMVYITLAGNTVMTHLLLGLDTSGLGEAPFWPASLEASEVEIEGYRVHTLPMISAFVGGDIYAGLLASKPAPGEMLVDLGTNGEIALRSDRRLYVTATAAGPAFARPGDTLMGSDRIALLSDMIRRGQIDCSGFLVEEEDSALTQQDIRELMLGKAAIAAGIEVLCKENDMVDITKVYLSGGFGYRLSPKAAVNIGLLPKETEGRIQTIGNSSLYGAYLYGLGERLPDYGEIVTINLATRDEFTGSFYKHMTFTEH